jgi:hypothetical protein
MLTPTPPTPIQMPLLYAQIPLNRTFLAPLSPATQPFPQDRPATAGPNAPLTVTPPLAPRKARTLRHALTPGRHAPSGMRSPQAGTRLSQRFVPGQPGRSCTLLLLRADRARFCMSGKLLHGFRRLRGQSLCCATSSRRAFGLSHRSHRRLSHRPEARNVAFAEDSPSSCFVDLARLSTLAAILHDFSRLGVACRARSTASGRPCNFLPVGARKGLQDRREGEDSCKIRGRRTVNACRAVLRRYCAAGTAQRAGRRSGQGGAPGRTAERAGRGGGASGVASGVPKRGSGWNARIGHWGRGLGRGHPGEGMGNPFRTHERSSFSNAIMNDLDNGSAAERESLSLSGDRNGESRSFPGTFGPEIVGHRPGFSSVNNPCPGHFGRQIR